MRSGGEQSSKMQTAGAHVEALGFELWGLSTVSRGATACAVYIDARDGHHR